MNKIKSWPCATGKNSALWEICLGNECWLPWDIMFGDGLSLTTTHPCPCVTELIFRPCVTFIKTVLVWHLPIYALVWLNLYFDLVWHVALCSALCDVYRDWPCSIPNHICISRIEFLISFVRLVARMTLSLSILLVTFFLSSLCDRHQNWPGLTPTFQYQCLCGICVQTGPVWHFLI